MYTSQKITQLKTVSAIYLEVSYERETQDTYNSFSVSNVGIRYYFVPIDYFSKGVEVSIGE